MEEKEEFDFEEFKKQAISDMYAGRPFSGEKGIFAPLMNRIAEATFSRSRFNWGVRKSSGRIKSKGSI